MVKSFNDNYFVNTISKGYKLITINNFNCCIINKTVDSETIFVDCVFIVLTIQALKVVKHLYIMVYKVI